MKPEDVVAHFGTQLSAAKALGVTQSAISQWFAAGEIPYLRQTQIQVATKGKLKAERIKVAA